ncbi:MAG: hypothetical protein ABF246_10460 [Winogradskyella sp.]
MEPILLSLIPNFTNRLISKTVDTKEKSKALQSLIKVVLVECRINLKILDIAKHKKIEKSESFILLSHLSNDASKTIFSFVNDSIIKSSLNKISNIKIKDDGIENDIGLVSIISKIELLKILATDLDKLSKDRIVKITLIISKLHKQLSEFVTELNKEVSNY